VRWRGRKLAPIALPVPDVSDCENRYTVCTDCGAAGSVNIVPNWHDMIGHAMPFSKGWRNRALLLL
jgi:hypothetical protein